MKYRLLYLLSKRAETAVLIRSYGDAGGKSSDQDGYVLLVCHSREINSWKPLENHWSAVLGDYGVKSLHTTDLMAHPPRGDYAKWSNTKVARFSDDLLSVIEMFHLGGWAYAVSVDGYRKAAQLRALPTIEQICLYFLFCSIGAYYDSVPLSFVFDRGDRFRHWADQMWQAYQRRGRLMKRVVEIDSIASEFSPAVQTTDLSAWWARTHWVRSPSSYPKDTLVRLSKNIHYHHSQRLEMDDLLSFDFDRLVSTL